MNNRIDQAEVGVATPANPATSGSVRWVGKGVAAAVLLKQRAGAKRRHESLCNSRTR